MRLMLIHASAVVLVQVPVLQELSQRANLYAKFQGCLLWNAERTAFLLFLTNIIRKEVYVMEARVNKEMIIGDMLQIDPGIAAILMASGMHCIGCPASQGESLEEAAMVHGLQVDELVNDVNEYLAKK